jgi:hypothetical protein
VLQLFVVKTSEDPINRFTNPNPRLSHSNMRQYETNNFVYGRVEKEILIRKCVFFCLTALLFREMGNIRAVLAEEDGKP